MSRHISRKERWWTCSQTGRPRCEGGYIWPAAGMWHCMLYVKHGMRYIGCEKRERQAKMRLEDAIACEKKGLGYPPVPRSGLDKRRRRR